MTKLEATSGYDFLPHPLQQKEEEKLTFRAFRDDKAAKNKLIEHNLRLVFHVSNRFKKKVNDAEDLTSVGTIGLIKAVNNFDPTKKIKLCTYAARCIENEILMYLRKSKKHASNKSLQDSVNTDKEGNELSILDMLGTEKEEIEEHVSLKSEFEILLGLINNLPEKEKNIIKYRYGIGVEKMKQADVAKKLDISQSYISRIERKIIDRLKSEYKELAIH